MMKQIGLILILPIVASAQATIGTVTYQDLLGVSAPEQNLRFSSLDSGNGIPAGLQYRSNRVMSVPSATEVAWQQMSNGDLMVRASGGIPASIFPTTIGPMYAYTGFIYSINGPCLAAGTIVQFETLSGGSLPAQVSAGTNYYITACSGYHYYVSASPGGPNINFTVSGLNGGWVMLTVPFVVNGATFTSAAHGYANGNTVEFGQTDNGSLPAGLSANTVYTICNATANTFQVSATGNCSNVVVTTSGGSGIPEILSTLQWTLQSGAPTTATTSNSPVANVNGNYWQVSNGLTGIKIPTNAYEAANGYTLAPIQSLQMADGTWTPNSGTMQLDYGMNHATASTPAGYSVVFTESGLLEISLQAQLQVNRAYNYYYQSGTLTANPATNTFAWTSQGWPYSVYVAASTVPGVTVGRVYYVVNQITNVSFQLATTPGGTPITLGSGTANFDFLTQEPGPGYYNVTVTMDANTKAIQVLEDHTIHNYFYNLNIRPNLVADTGRFRTSGGFNPLTSFGNAYIQIPVTALSLSGTTLTITAPSHGLTGTPTIQLGKTSGIVNANNITFTATVVDANTLSVTCGACTGTTGSGGFVRSLQVPAALGYIDFFVDLLGNDRISSYTSTPSLLEYLGSQYEPNNGQDTGHYWMLYNSAGSSSSNAIGIFLGKGSLQYYGEYMHGPGVFDTPSTSSQGFSIWDKGESTVLNYYSAETRKSWAFWVSTNADILPPAQFQPIDVVRDTLVGISANKVNSYTLSFPDPPGGWPNLYESGTAISDLTSLLKNGTPFCGSPTCLLSAVQSDFIDATLAQLLLDPSSTRIGISLMPLVAELKSFATIFYTQLGNLDPGIAYYQGVYPCVRYEPLATLVLSNSAASEWSKQQAKHFLGFCAGFMWDPDFYSNDPSLSKGLENQQSQFLQQKAQFATELSSNPVMQPLVSSSVQNIETNLLASINQYGAGYASWHYQGAATDQALFGWLNLASVGLVDITQFPEIALFGQWYMSGITPPEVRFGNRRMYISDGDGNTEPETSPGLLATLLRPGFPALASNLAFIWSSQGLNASTISSTVAPSLIAIDLSIPPLDPQLGSQHFPGSHSMLRSGWGTRFENAVDFLYGGFYSAQGHAHEDTGRVSAYLLGAPVSIDWNPNLYSPQVPGRFQHSTVCLDSELKPVRWNQDNSPLTACGSQFTGASPDKTNLIQTSTFTGSSSATASWTKPSDGTSFTRTVTLLNYDPNYAILQTFDSFSGAQASSPKTLTWNLMAANGPVETPNGTVVVTRRQNLNNNGVLPSASPTYTLEGDGLQQFAFEGESWPNHVTKGVDFDVYTRDADGQEFVIGNWCHNQYQNNCALESQDILRLHGTGGFNTWIVARKKGVSDPAVSLAPCGISVSLAGTLCFDNTYSQYDDGQGTQTLATYDTSSHSAFGMTISGGPAECVLSGKHITCTIHGWQPSTRVIAVPPGFVAEQPVTYDADGRVNVPAESAPIVLHFIKYNVIVGE